MGVKSTTNDNRMIPKELNPEDYPKPYTLCQKIEGKVGKAEYKNVVARLQGTFRRFTALGDWRS
jgi:hypothetical protein